MRLIDADVLIEKFAKEAKRTSDTSFAKCLMYVVTCLDYAPTIEQPKAKRKVCRKWIKEIKECPMSKENTDE